MGVNDVLFSGCVDSVPDQLCLLAPDGPFNQIAANLPVILGALRQAADDDTPIVAMNYYNTFLAFWLLPGGQSIATSSALLLDLFNNQVLGTTYAAFDITVADVAGAFASGDFNTFVPFPPPHGAVPLNVALICRWTYMCFPHPVGPNVHATPAGYGVIAEAFARTIGVLGDDGDSDGDG